VYKPEKQVLVAPQPHLDDKTKEKQ
jgi:hypothetical protein